MRTASQLVFVALTMLPSSPLMAQVLDRGVLLVRQGEQVIAREEFSLRRVTGPDGSDGFVLTVLSAYPPDAPTITLMPTVEYGADSLPSAMQFDVGTDSRHRILVGFGERRITMRAVTATGGETAREYRASPRALVSDDSVFALYALLPGTASGGVDLFAPRHGRRSTAQLERRGTQQVLVGRQRVNLSLYTLETGTQRVEVWFDDQGRLTRVVVPARGITAERATVPEP